MLSQLLEQAGYATLCLPVDHASLAEMLALLEIKPDDVICISALPPFAFPPARTMCKLIRERFPKLKIVIGVWGFAGDVEKAKARFERTQPDRLLTSLAQAVAQIQELIQPKESLAAARPPGGTVTLMSAAPSLLWFRQDLRLSDHPALAAALGRRAAVIPVFVWAPEEEGPWPPGAASRWWLDASLARLQGDLEKAARG